MLFLLHISHWTGDFRPPGPGLAVDESLTSNGAVRASRTESGAIGRYERSSWPYYYRNKKLLEAF